MKNTFSVTVRRPWHGPWRLFEARGRLPRRCCKRQQEVEASAECLVRCLFLPRAVTDTCFLYSVLTHRYIGLVQTCSARLSLTLTREMSGHNRGCKRDGTRKTTNAMSGNRVASSVASTNITSTCIRLQYSSDLMAHAQICTLKEFRDKFN